jgi:hypothetical protein
MLLLCIGQLTSNQELGGSTIEPSYYFLHYICKPLLLRMQNVLSDNEKVVLLFKRLLGNYPEWKGVGEVKNLSTAILLLVATGRKN